MDPVSHPVEVVPLQQINDGTPVQAGGPTVVQDTIVDIPTDPPSDHIIWSLFCFVYSNYCCLGLLALTYSIKARNRKLAGDLKGARRPGAIACFLNILSTAIIVSAIIIFICLLSFKPSEAWHYYTLHNTYRNYISYRLFL